MDGAALVRRYERNLTFLGLIGPYVAGIILVVYVFFANQVFPQERSSAGVIWAMLPAALPMVVVGTISSILLGRRRIRSALAWLAENRQPTALEGVAVCALPRRVATITATHWLIVFFSLFPYLVLVVGTGIPPRALLTSALSTLLLAVAPWSLTYLLLDRALSPVYARAFRPDAAVRPKSMGLLTRLVLAWGATSGLPIAGVALVLIGTGTDPEARARVIPLIASICILGTLAGVAVAVFSGRALIDPLQKVQSALRSIEQGDLQVQLSVSDTAEIGDLQVGVNRMVAGLRERQRLRDLFGRHVGAEVAEQALLGDFKLGGERRSASALFVDVIGSTQLAQSRSPEDVVTILNAFFDAVIRTVSAEGGFVNKFQGDGALCIFGAPADQPDHAQRALRAARALHAELLSLPADGFEAAIGVSSGEVVAGNVGSADRYEYTVVGDPVNEAARLTEQAKSTPGHILVGEATIKRADEEAEHWTPAGAMTLRGRSDPTLAYELTPANR